MIELDKHIEVLLLRNDCVIVPGLGGFTASHISAKYDINDHLFLPPLRTLGFNPKLCLNDSLLVHSYSEVYDISYPEAYTRIENETNELKRQIYNEGSYELNDIGILYVNDDGNIEFSPCESGILTPSLYSLSSFDITKNSENAYYEDKETHMTPIPREIQLMTENNHITQSDDPEKEKYSYNKSTRINYILLRNVTAIIVAIIAFLFISEPINNDMNMVKMTIGNGMIKNVINNGYKNITSKNNIHLKEKSDKTEVDETNMKTESNKPIVSETKKTEENYFCIVLASRVNRKNADIFVSQLKRRGYEEAIVLAEKGKSVKVVYGRYKTNNDAYNALNNFRGNEYFYDAWIYQVKNQTPLVKCIIDGG